MFAPLRTRVRLRPSCDDEDDDWCPAPARPSILRDLLVTCAPVALTALLEDILDKRKAERRREEAEFKKMLAEVEVSDDEAEEDDDKGTRH